jgi:hypothetical protein
MKPILSLMPAPSSEVPEALVEDEEPAAKSRRNTRVTLVDVHARHWPIRIGVSRHDDTTGQKGCKQGSDQQFNFHG